MTSLGTFTSSGNNIIEDAGGFTGIDPNDRTGIDPGLNALALVDGTYVHTFDTTSIAYNGATGSSETVDQRGFARKSGPDIGAYELLLPDLVTTASEDGGLSINEDGGNDVYLQADDGIGSADLTALTYEHRYSTTDETGQATRFLLRCWQQR